MAYQHILELIQHYEAFEQGTGQSGVLAFAQWVSAQAELKGSDFDPEDERLARSADEQILQGLGMLSNHAKHYIKTATRDTPLSGWNDTILLIVLSYRGPSRKTDIIRDALMDLSSGIEVIKRLVKRGFLEEYQDSSDKRAKLVKITPEGEELTAEMKKRVTAASSIVAGNLSPAEKARLIPMIFKLVHFHDPIFRDDYGAELDYIADKYKAED